MSIGPHAAWWEDPVEPTYEQLAYQDSVYSIAVAAGSVGIWEWWPQERQIRLHPVWVDMMGYDVFDDDFDTLKQIDTYLDLVHPDDRLRVKRAMARFARSDAEHWERRFRMVHRNRSVLSWISRGSVVEEDDGRPTRVVGADLFVERVKR